MLYKIKIDFFRKEKNNDKHIIYMQDIFIILKLNFSLFFKL